MAAPLPCCHQRLRTAAATPPADAHWVSALDTLVANVHFPAATAPADVAYKAVAVNVSDLAAMGAEPVSISVAIAAPADEPDWLRGIDDGLAAALDTFGLSLDELDLLSGPGIITVHANGTVPRGMALTRAGARPGDRVFVSGTVGDAAAGLDIALGRSEGAVSAADRELLLGRLERPTPRVRLGIALRGHAHAAIDVSDGLAQDLGHILEASNVGAVIRAGDLPLSAELRRLDSPDRAARRALHGGDDYEICFTASAQTVISPGLAGCGVTHIGEIRDGEGLLVLDHDGQPLAPDTGYDHFG